MRVLAIDTETTGLIANRLMSRERQPHVIQFSSCLLDLDSAEIFHEYSTYVKPPARDLLSDKILKITGIRWEDLEGAPAFAAVAEKVTSIIESAPVVVAHNLAYDRGVIDVETARLGRSVAWPRGICSVEQTIHLVGRRLDLSELHQFLTGSGHVNAHRADADVSALVRCLVEMRRRDML